MPRKVGLSRHAVGFLEIGLDLLAAKSRYQGPRLQAIMLCFMPPYLTEQARNTVLPQRLDQLLSNRWFPAMNHICEAVGFSEKQIEKLTNDVANYFINGPRAT